MSITQTILELRIEWCFLHNFTPQAINNGVCDEFAACIEDKGFGDAVWGNEIPYKYWSPTIPHWCIDKWAEYHCFVEYNGRFYDSECPQGCLYPNDLPFYKRYCGY